MNCVIRGLMSGTAMTVVAAPALAQEQSFGAGTRGSAKSSSLLNWAADRQDAFTQADVNLEWKAPGVRYTIQAYVRNIENERPVNYASFTGNDVNVYNFIFGAPRNYGVQGTVKF